MKQRLNTGGVINGVVITVMIVMSMIILCAPAMAVPTLSDNISRKIAEMIASPDERDSVLQNAIAAVKAGVPEDIIAPVIERTLGNGVSGDGLGEMLQALAAAREKDLPLEPLAGKILEGLVKNVGEKSIIRAMERVEERMEFSAGLAKGLGMSKEKREDLIIETAGAIAAGMDRDSLRDIFSVMAGDRSSGRLAPVQIMEMVKAASGYGVDSRKVGKYAAALIEDRSADKGDIAKFLKDLSEKAYKGISDNDPDDIVEKYMENMSSTGEDETGDAIGEENMADENGGGGSGGGEEHSGDEGGPH